MNETLDAKGLLPITYLGLPLKSGVLKRNDWSKLTERIGYRLDGWKGKTLAFGGKVTLVKAMLSSIPIYYISYFKIPIWVRLKIESEEHFCAV